MIRERWRREQKKAWEDILGYLRRDFVHEAYSKELQTELKIDLTIQTINKICRQMEDEGLVDSRLAFPPHGDLRGNGGMGRRYYWAID